MKRPDKLSGYTLIEIMVATALTLTMMAAVVQIFGIIGASVTESRAVLEMSDRLRSTQMRLTNDLAGVTATMVPPGRPEAEEGGFEIGEGPYWGHGKGGIRAEHLRPQKENPDGTLELDLSVGDNDDWLWFTTRGTGDPFVGRCASSPNGTVKSNVAEVIWFVRGTTLYRRQLLIAPGVNLENVPEEGFYKFNDLSVHRDPTSKRLVANSLGDLTRRDRRFAHDPRPQAWPNRAHTTQAWNELGFPTLCESSTQQWPVGDPLPEASISAGDAPFDAWYNPNPWAGVDRATGHLEQYYNPKNPEPGQRISEDVILTNVIGFDVKVWDPGADNLVGKYVDLGDNGGFGDQRQFNLGGLSRSGLAAGANTTGKYCIYDTYSQHYEYDGLDQDNSNGPDQGTNGFDDIAGGGVDDITERETIPPYPVPLRGIQVKIRVVEPDSRQIREVTIVQDFLPK
ncbi:MAG: prepilin-type N-terminal cleavage/methylation domain-containing protein [Candidatus Nealsonbacteria bacterium]|nr:prepilin-type N-terminal cleavage/methylation domain-containing protein [Candidatus Nealsonbacteria bacterium]